MPNPRRAAPFRSVDPAAIIRQARGRRLVVVAPHPDDETLGCGGLIARAARAGCRIAVVALTDGGASHPGSACWPPARLGPLRAGEMRRALARLGAGGCAVRRLGWPDGHVAGAGNAIHLRRTLVALCPGIVLVTSAADHHPDHQAAARLVRRAVGGLDVPVLDYAVWSRVDRSTPRAGRFVAAKQWAMAAHRSQLGSFIADSPGGFHLRPALLRSLIGGPETFTRCAPLRRAVRG